MGRPKDDWTAQLAEEEAESMGEGARRELLGDGDAEDSSSD